MNLNKDMKVVCIDTDFSMDGIKTSWITICEQLEYGKVYEASFVFFNQDSKNPVEWNKNYLNLEGFSELDWFPTKNFVTLDVWRQKVLDELIS